MERNLFRQEITQGVNFNVIRDGRFKTGRISVNMFLPLDHDKASVYAVLPYVLGHACQKYPDFTSLNRRLDELYGASVFSDVNKIGDMQVLTVSASFLDDRFALGGESLSGELTQLLCDIIFDPLLRDGMFDREIVEQEKRQLIELIDSEYNDKRTLARLRCEQIMCQGERFGINRLGSREQVLQLTPQDVFEAWQNVLQNARIEIMMLGDADSGAAFRIFNDAFSQIARGDTVPCETQIIKGVGQVKEQRDAMNVAQSKLVMGFRTGVALCDPEVMAMRVAVAIFGATPQSKLFLNVREKLSLCYYCSAKYDRNKGIMLVQSGVEQQNIDRARNEILNQLKSVQHGDFTDEELRNTKMSLANSYRTIGDLLSGLENFYLSQVFDAELLPPEQFVRELGNVTKEQVTKVAQMIRLDTVYALVGGEMEGMV